jgi:cyanophycinase
MRSLAFLLLTAALMSTGLAQPAKPPYQYTRIGSAQDAVTQPKAGFALMGGGTDLDEAFRWMAQRANGGDFLVLRSTGSDAYNPYIQKLDRLNSVATLILPSREAAMHPFVAATIAHAEAIFIAGGDQANYIRNWTNTPVQTEINKAIQRGVPVGGTSAGLAVLGEWAYSAEGDKPDDPNLDSKTALADPFGSRVTLTHDFLSIPILRGIITDTHFAKRDRMGRLLAFLAHIHSLAPKHPVRGLGIEEKSAVLLEPNGQGVVVGHGSAYLVEIVASSAPLKQGEPLTAAFSLQKFDPGRSLNLNGSKDGPQPYTLSVESGILSSQQKSGAVY